MSPPNLESPLELFFSWQSLLVAAAIAGVTQSVKTALERWLAIRAGTGQSGRDLRQQSWFLNDVLLPAVPLITGALVGAVIPVRPEVLVHYAQGAGRATAIFALWGLTIGQFSDYLYVRLKRILAAAVGARASVPPAAPAAPSPVEEPKDEEVPPVETDRTEPPVA